MAVEFHHITVANLAAAARFNLAIDVDGTVLNERFGFQTVLGEVSKLEQLPKSNGFVANKDVIWVRSAHE